MYQGMHLQGSVCLMGLHSLQGQAATVGSSARPPGVAQKFCSFIGKFVFLTVQALTAVLNWKKMHSSHVAVEILKFRHVMPMTLSGALSHKFTSYVGEALNCHFFSGWRMATWITSTGIFPYPLGYGAGFWFSWHLDLFSKGGQAWQPQQWLLVASEMRDSMRIFTYNIKKISTKPNGFSAIWKIWHWGKALWNANAKSWSSKCLNYSTWPFTLSPLTLRRVLHPSYGWPFCCREIQHHSLMLAPVA